LLGAAGLLAALVGCGTNSPAHQGPPAPLAGAPAVLARTDRLAKGSKAPAFTLIDQKGEKRTLEDFLKKGKVALVYYRSAKW